MKKDQPIAAKTCGGGGTSWSSVQSKVEKAHRKLKEF